MRPTLVHRPAGALPHARNARQRGRASMAEIRRIKDSEGETVATLWDEDSRTGIDGAPLPVRGRRNIARMLDIASWHDRQLCLVAVEQERIVGFGCASIVAGTGLLPGLIGEIDAFYVTPNARGQGTSRTLAQATVAELRARGAGVIHNLVCIEDDEAQAFWQAQGFERDMVCLSLYERSEAR
ncbi:MAG: GNAT family N-acetyltransferase [Solirubrobacteraceae bacterium]